MASAAERKRKERKLMKEAGFALVQAWVPEKDLETVTKYLDRIRRRHEKKQAQ
jgi:Protein  of unknown function (DUF3018)